MTIKHLKEDFPALVFANITLIFFTTIIILPYVSSLSRWDANNNRTLNGWVTFFNNHSRDGGNFYFIFLF